MRYRRPNLPILRHWEIPAVIPAPCLHRYRCGGRTPAQSPLPFCLMGKCSPHVGGRKTFPRQGEKRRKSDWAVVNDCVSVLFLRRRVQNSEALVICQLGLPGLDSRLRGCVNYMAAGICVYFALLTSHTCQHFFHFEVENTHHSFLPSHPNLIRPWVKELNKYVFPYPTASKPLPIYLFST